MNETDKIIFLALENAIKREISLQRSLSYPIFNAAISCLKIGADSKVVLDHVLYQLAKTLNSSFQKQTESEKK